MSHTSQIVRKKCFVVKIAKITDDEQLERYAGIRIAIYLRRVAIRRYGEKTGRAIMIPTVEEFVRDIHI